jgi:hypothetical protein
MLKKSVAIEEADHGGLKPALILRALRGAEAPLLHGCTHVSEFSTA